MMGERHSSIESGLQTSVLQRRLTLKGGNTNHINSLEKLEKVEDKLEKTIGAI
jgi:hypothetical protein